MDSDLKLDMKRIDEEVRKRLIRTVDDEWRKRTAEAPLERLAIAMTTEIRAVLGGSALRASWRVELDETVPDPGWIIRKARSAT